VGQVIEFGSPPAGNHSRSTGGRVMKRSIAIAGHKTSISVEEPFWNGLREIAVAKRMKVADLVAWIDNNRQQGNLSSHVRLFVLDHFQTLLNHHQTLAAPTLETAGQAASSPTAP
jgi:predicted DNA-binding ribbon-helix-helix protein